MAEPVDLEWPSPTTMNIIEIDIPALKGEKTDIK